MAGAHPRILFVAHDAGIGGAQLALTETLVSLVGRGFVPYVVSPTVGPFMEELHRLRIECHWGLTQRWIFFHKPSCGLLHHPYLWALLSLLTLPLRLTILVVFAKWRRVELVYSNTITVLDGALLARILGVPHVWHLHEAVAGNADLASPWPITWLPEFILNWADQIIVNSESLRNNLFRGLPHNKVRVIPNGVNVDVSEHQQARLSLSFIPERAQVTAIIGRLNENKGIIDYIKALASLQYLFPDARHLIIGDGDPAYKTFLQEAVIGLGLGDRVHFLGYRRDVRDLMSCIDILVSTSYRESFGRTLIEAMAAGVPVISSRSGGPEEIIVDGECGFLVDVGDVTAIADRMARLLGDQVLAQAFGAAGRRRVIECFDLKNTTKEIAQAIEDALVCQK